MELSRMDTSQSGQSIISSSSHFPPNFPVTEPVFYIPRVPQILDAHEPVPPKKPPPPGYDLKTLRKQVEYLQEEINERVKNYNALCGQNQQLWNYVQELLEANKFNAGQMRDRVSKLNEELRIAQKERFQLLEKLELAKNSKKMLHNLTHELEEAQVSVEELQKRREEAEKELKEAQRERESLEDTLHNQLDKLHNTEDVLQQYRNRQYEDLTLDTADDFFFSSHVILKAAYTRFKAGVMKRKRLSNIHTVLTKVYQVNNLSDCWKLWLDFLFRKRLMRRSQNRRQYENIILHFKKWKVFTALEKFLRQSQRRRLLTTTWQCWLEYKQERKFENWAMDTTNTWKLKCFKRKFFQAWKNQIMFLGWCEERIVRKESEAIMFFHKKIFRAWKEVARRESTKGFAFSVVVAHNFKRFRFQAWRALCQLNWQQRGKLLRRFFTNITRAIENRRLRSRRSKLVSAHWIGYKKRSYMRRWRTFLRHAVNRLPTMITTTTTTNSNNSAIANRNVLLKQRAVAIHRHYYSRLLQSSFLFMRWRLAVLQRQGVSSRLAMQHYLNQMAWKYLSIWRHRTKKQTHFRHHEKLAMYSFVLVRWHKRTHELKVLNRRKAGLVTLRRRYEGNLLIETLEKWYTVFLRRKRAGRLGAFLKRTNTKERLQQLFSHWRSTWTNALYWRHKELLLDQQRADSLHRLSQMALDNYEKEQNSLEEENKQLEETLINIQELLADKKNEIEQQEARIQETEKSKSLLQDEINQLQLRLKDLEQESERWHALELTLQNEHQKQDEERKKRKQEADERVRKMQEESLILQRQLEVAHQSSVQAVQEQTKVAEEELKSLEDETDRVDSLISEKQFEIQTLEKEEEELSLELTKIQRKVQEVTREGDLLRTENEKMLRKRVSELKVAETEAGVAQARVMALYDLLEEARKEQEKMHVQEVSTQERREMGELAQQRKAFESHIGEVRQRLNTSSSGLLVDTVSLWETRKREDLVNLASPRLAGTDDSLIQSPLVMQPSKPLQATPEESYKRYRYGGINIVESPENKPGLKAADLSSPPARRSQPSNQFEDFRKQELFPPSSPASSSMVSSSLSPASSQAVPPSATETTGGDREYLDARDAIRSLTQRLHARYANI